MTRGAPSAVRQALDAQLAALTGGDLEAVLRNYTSDAALVRAHGAHAGEALRSAPAAYLTLEPRLLRLTHYVEYDDTVFYRAVMRLGGEPKEVIGTMVFEDRRIRRQTAGVLSGLSRHRWRSTRHGTAVC